MKTTRVTFALAACMGVAIGTAAFANAPEAGYDFGERTRQLAFDPARFFESAPADSLFMQIVYSGDDYGFPVYSIAVRKGCTESDTGEARRTCGDRMIARMVRAPFDGIPERPRWRGAKLFGALAEQDIADDRQLAAALDSQRLEWLEADIGTCEAGLAHLGASDVDFFTDPPRPTNTDLGIVLHADKISFDYRGDYLTRSSYFGWVKPGSPGMWAAQFANSLEDCWAPASAPAPWSKPLSAH